MATVDLDGVRVVKGGVAVLDGIDLSVAQGELLGIVGASGSGKTSLLRAVAGLDDLASGTIRIDGQDQRPHGRRDVAMVFQHNVLFPNRDVEGNVAFPLEVRRLPAEEVKQRVWAEGRALHIDALMSRNPRELSAGQQQLVQIARAMVRAPAVFLMDEPLARLDTKLRISLRGDLKIMQRGYGVTTMYATNDPVEAMSVADRIAVMERGSIIQAASPEAVYHRPRNLRVAELMGELAVLDVVVEGNDRGSWLVGDGFRIRAWAPAIGSHAGGRVLLGVRPGYVEMSDSPDALARIRRLEHHGAAHLARLSLGRHDVVMRLRHPTVRAGDEIGVRFAKLLVFDPDTGETIPT